FNLTFNFDAIIRIEQKTGMKLLDKSILSEMLSLTVLSAAFWGSVCENHPEYESDEGLRNLRSLLNNPANLARVTDALFESYLLSLPEQRRKAMVRARDEFEKKRREEAGVEEDHPTLPSGRTNPSTETELPKETGSSSQPSQDLTSDSALASSA